MAKPKKKMKLMAYLKTGPTAMHSGAWRHPATELSNIFAPERYEHIARVLEAACFDGCFYADTLGLPESTRAATTPTCTMAGRSPTLIP